MGLFSSSSTTVINQAYRRAKETLKDRYVSHGIYAGKRHFSDVWLRDSCYASLGALELGDKDVVLANLETMFAHQHESGQIPLRVGQPHFLLKYFGFDAKIPKPRFTEDKGISTPMDSNSLLLITVGRYIQISNDKSFLIRHFDAIKRAMTWNFEQDLNHDLLIEEGPYAGWADSLKKSGTVLYTNVLHFAAVKNMAYLCHTIGRKADEAHYSYLADCIQSYITRLFWNGEHFIDWVSPTGERITHFSTDGNLFAIIFGLASREQSLSILNFIQKNALDSGFSTKTVFPEYPKKWVYPLFRLLGLHDYHNGLEWLWVGCADVIAKSMMGMHSEAHILLERISKKIIEHNGVFEVYDNGKPVNRVFYRSEDWFAWSSGLFVWACHQVGVKGL